MFAATQLQDSLLRTATAADLLKIERLLTDSGLPTVGVRDAIADFAVADAGGDIVGVAGLEVCCDNALLRSVAVRDDYRSKGVGRALVNRVIAQAEARGIHALYLLTTSAERYFPSFGFVPVDRTRVPEDIRGTAEFTSACPSTATVMTRPITAG